MTPEEEVARRRRAEIEEKNREIVFNYNLFKEKYFVILEKLSKDIKNKRRQCNNFTYGNGLLGISKKRLYFIYFLIMSRKIQYLTIDVFILLVLTLMLAYLVISREA